MFKDRKMPKHLRSHEASASLRLTFNLRPNLEAKDYFEGQNLAKYYNGGLWKSKYRFLVPLFSVRSDNRIIFIEEHTIG